MKRERVSNERGRRDRAYWTLAIFVAGFALLGGTTTLLSVLASERPSEVIAAERARIVRKATSGVLVSERRVIEEVASRVAMIAASGVEEQPEQSELAIESQNSSISDTEWASFPRVNRPFSQLIRMGARLDSKLLYRHRSLNPKDRYIYRQSRLGLAMLVAAIGHELETIEAVFQRVLRREMGALIASGDIDGVPIESLKVTEETRDEFVALAGPDARDPLECQTYWMRPGLEASGLRKEPPFITFFSGAKKSLYLGRLDELPLTQQAEDARRHTQMELATATVAFFRSIGCLSPEDGHSLLMRAARAVVRE